jgi:hypothetical protein
LVGKPNNLLSARRAIIVIIARISGHSSSAPLSFTSLALRLLPPPFFSSLSSRQHHQQYIMASPWYGLIIGIPFGFLLHKAGVFDPNVIADQLRMTDMTMLKVFHTLCCC